MKTQAIANNSKPLSEKSNSTNGIKSIYMKLKRNQQLELYLIMLPVLVHIFIFCYIPMYGILIAFQNYVPGNDILSINGNVEWVGLKYFVEFMTSRDFWRLIKNTLVLSFLNLGIGFWIPVAFALTLNEVRSSRYKKIVQTASYLPHFISAVVVAGMVLSFISSDGIVNQFREMFGLDSVAYNISPEAFPFIYTVTNIWKSFGWNSILYLSAISAIDPCLYEAAKLDGSTRMQQIWYVTLPMIKPTIILLFIFAVGGILNADTETILLLYNPATYETADVIGTFVYRDGLTGGRFSYGTAVGIFISTINFSLVFISNYIARKVGDFSLW